MCRSRLWLLYWVRTAMRSTPAFTRFDRAKSISRYSPAKGTAGLARSAVSGARRLPSPPASTMPITLGSAMSFLQIRHVIYRGHLSRSFLEGHSSKFSESVGRATAEDDTVGLGARASPTTSVLVIVLLTVTD